jgi:hypothetical protein
MEALDFDHTIFSRPDAGDESLFVVFYMGVLKNDARSLEQGRHIFDDVECVRIIVPGDKNSVVDRPASDNDKRRFAKQYAMFKQGVKEEDQVTGTRLTDWPFLSRAQCEELRYLGIRTVEQLAEVRDDITTKVPGLVALKKNAGVWLGKTKSAAEAAKITKTLEDQAAEIDTLKKVIKGMGEREDARLAAIAAGKA